jgi:hypothetical protein
VVTLLVLIPPPLSTAVAEVVACIPMNVQLPDKLEVLVLLVLLSFLQAIKQKKTTDRMIKPPDFLMKRISTKTQNRFPYCRKRGQKSLKYNSKSWTFSNKIIGPYARRFALHALRFTL